MSNKIIFTTEEIEELKDLYLNKDWYIKDLVIKYKCSYPTIARIIKENNLEKSKYKVDPELIIQDYKNGLSLTQMSKKYPYTRSVFSRILIDHGYKIVNRWNETKFNNHIFDSIDNEEKAYWLGFIFADGYISSHTEGVKPKYAFELCVKGSDYNHMVKFKTFLNHTKDIYKGSVKLNCKIYERSRVCVSNKHFWNTLNDLGCTPRKSLILKFPDINVFKSKDLIRHFIRGYFDGDGCFSYHKYKTKITPVVGFIGTKEMLDSIQRYSTFWGSKTLKDKRHKHNTFSIYYPLKNVFDFLNYLYKDSTVYLDRKYKLYQFFKNGCRSLEEFNELLSGKIEEPCDGNIEVNS